MYSPSTKPHSIVGRRTIFSVRGGFIGGIALTRPPVLSGAMELGRICLGNSYKSNAVFKLQLLWDTSKLMATRADCIARVLVMRSTACVRGFKGVFAGLIVSLMPFYPALGQIYYPRPLTPISIISPANLSVFYAPVDIPTFAYARDGFSSTGPVRYYAGTNYLGIGQKLHIASPPNPFPGYFYGRDQYSLVWTNAPVGQYALTAVMTNLITSRAVTSAPVYITVQGSAPPATM
jgi:hypothetical protein